MSIDVLFQDFERGTARRTDIELVASEALLPVPEIGLQFRFKRLTKKASWEVARLKRRVAHQRADWLHKLTSDTVRRNSLIAGEKLNVKGMTATAKKGTRKKQKAGLNRSILSVGFGMVGPMLAYKLAEAGGFHLESPTQQLKPSQRCAQCWELTPKTLNSHLL